MTPATTAPMINKDYKDERGRQKLIGCGAIHGSAADQYILSSRQAFSSAFPVSS
jgi:hypothetical protein